MSGKPPKYLQVVQTAPKPGAVPVPAPAEEKPSRTIHDAPEDFDETHRNVWNEIVKQTAGTLQDCDRWALTTLVTAICLHKTASAKVREYGSVIKSPNGYPIQSPYVADMNKQAANITRLSSELGLTPAARQRGKIVKKPTQGRSPFAGLKTLDGN